MAGKASTPLKSAIGGDIDKLTDKQTKSALTEAVGKLGRVTKLAETSKEQVIDTGTALMHSAETMGSLFMGSMAEGFFGPEKLRLGGVDMRAPTGLLMQGYGLYQILSGESGGEHFLSIGNGVTGSWLASVGQDAGKALRERRSGGVPAPTQGQPAPAPGTTFRGEEPMVHVPALEGQYGPVYGGAAAPFGGPGLLQPPGVPAGYLPAPGWQSGCAPQYAPAQRAPQMSGPVREILPADDMSGHDHPAMHGYGPGPVAGYYPAPVAGYGDPAMHGYPGGMVAGAPGDPGVGYQQPRHVMQFTPEGGAPDSVQGPRQRMRFTPEAASRQSGQGGAGGQQAAVEGAPRQARRERDDAPGDDVAGPRQRMQQRRQARRQGMGNRFPRARRAEEEEVEAE